MARFLQVLEDTSTKEVTVGALSFRIRRIRSSDLAEAGVAGVVAFGTDALLALAKAHRAGEAKDADADALSEAAAIEAMRSVDPRKFKKATEFKEHIVCAGVTAIGDAKAGEWDDVRIVMDPKRSDPDAGVLSVDRLPTGCIGELADQITKLSGDDGEVAELVAGFRGRPDAAEAS